jgi:hypothetical protein
MSIHDAIVNATRQALSSYLAPDLVEQLTEEIIHRAAPEMEEALRAMAGFDLSRPPPSRGKAAAPAAANKTAKRGRPSKKEEAPAQAAQQAFVPTPAEHSNGNGGEPHIAAMDMI